MPDLVRPLTFPGLLGAPMRSLVKPMFRNLSIAASGLSAQRQRMEAIASNIANAETTRGVDGRPYQRLVVQMAERAAEPPPPAGAFPAGAAPGDLANLGFAPAFGMATTNLVDAANGVTVTGIARDTTEGPLVYDPAHPDADNAGYVRMPNVRVTDELVDLMDARRIYEANATVFQSTKAMLRRAIDI